MKFSKQLLKKFIALESVSIQDIYAQCNSIGLEVESLEHKQSPKGVVVGKVIEVLPHSNADKLQVCHVDVGGQILNIVCGAKNVAPNQFVPVALEGTRINNMTIKKSSLRGEMSEGMICSATELGFPKMNDGILELDSSVGILELGKSLDEYPLFNDDIFEINITPNRGDCLSLSGIARDLGTAFNIVLEDYNQDGCKGDYALGIGRFLQIVRERNIHSSLLYSMVEVKPFVLPFSFALCLAYNNQLDSNPLLSLVRYATLATGTIFTLYSSKMSLKREMQEQKISLYVKLDKDGVESVFNGDKLLTHIGIKQELDSLPIGNEDMCIVEASYIPPNVLAKQVALIKNFSKDEELYYRASRGSNPNLAESHRFLCGLFYQVGLGTYSGQHELIQNYPQHSISVSIHDINNLIGSSVSAVEVVSLLKKLAFEVEVASDESFLAIKPPSFRHDIYNKQDIAEEIMRIIGIDNIDAQPLLFCEKRSVDDVYGHYLFERNLAKRAISVGFAETIHFIFARKDRLRHLGLDTIPDDKDILNPITEELNTLRTTLLVSLLDSLSFNLKNGKKAAALFEMGSVFNVHREESCSMAFVCSKISHEALYPYAKDKEMTIFDFAQKVSQVIGVFELNLEHIKGNLCHPSQSAFIIKNGKTIGILAALHPAAYNEFDLDGAFIAEVNVDLLDIKQFAFTPFSKMQKSQKDLTLLISKHITFSAICKEIMALDIAEIKEVYPLDVYHDDSMEDSVISLTIRFVLQDDLKSLNEKDMNHILQLVYQQLQSCFGAIIR